MVVIDVVEDKKLGLEDLDHFWLANGAPCFIGNVKDICDHVEALGYQIYFVIAEEKIAYEENKVTKYTYQTQVFKVTNNYAGRSVTPCDDVVKLETLEKNAWFSLPKIPWSLVEKIDAFFRKVDDKLGVESIVLLTYDSEKTGPEGWGVLVPKQSNTGASCDYEADSIAGIKPDHVYIVGSAHSHPGMAAYASGTDHKDQADFDGLHITYGWKPSGGNKTEFHVELQMGGEGFIFRPDQVFEDAPKPPVDVSDIEDWANNVSKKSFAAGYQKTTSTTSFGSSRSLVGAAAQYNKTAEQSRVKAPADCPDITQNIVIGVIDELDKVCPFCNFAFVPSDINNRKCLTCHQYLAFEKESVSDITGIRSKNGMYSYDLQLDKGDQKPVYFWSRESGGKNTYICVFSSNTKGSLGAGSGK